LLRRVELDDHKALDHVSCVIHTFIGFNSNPRSVRASNHIAHCTRKGLARKRLVVKDVFVTKERGGEVLVALNHVVVRGLDVQSCNDTLRKR
jgi:hypothetical protein